MFYQKNTLSLFVATASLLSHMSHAKPYALRGSNSDTTEKEKRNLSENERSYLLVDERKNFDQAREYCKSLGMDLASISSAEENAIVAQLCESATKGGSLCWIGLAPQWLDGTEYIYQGNNDFLQGATVISGKQRSWVDYGGWRYSKGHLERAFICGELIPEEEITSSTNTTTTTTTTTTTSTETTTERPKTTTTTTSTTTTDSVEATEFMCPTGWTLYGSNQKCLKVVNQGKSFAGHESNCQGIAPEGWSGSLVSFHSQDDLDAAGTVCRKILDYSDGCSGGYACRTGLHYDGTTASFTDGSAVDYLPSSQLNMWNVGTEQCAQLADGNDDSMNCNNLRTFADGGGSCDSAYHKNKGLCQIWLDETGPDEIVPSTTTTTTTATPTTTAEPTTLATTTSTATTTTKPTTTTTTTTDEPWTHIPNTYCQYYAQGGDGNCDTGANFDDIWKRCMADGEDKCMGVMWNSCTGRTSDTTVPGAWKLMRAGQEVGDADHPTATCGGKNQARGHWDVFARSDLLITPTTTTAEISTTLATTTTSTTTTTAEPTTTTTTTTDEPWTHIPNTYCRYYAQGGDGNCSAGANFDDIWKQCMADGEDKCMGVMWNSCTGRTSDTTVPGAWKLMRAGQEVGDADHPTATCGGKNQARGHWDVFVRSDQV